MRKAMQNAMIFVLSIAMIFGLFSCSCRLEESYKEFNIKGLTNNVDDNYFTSDDFSFARIENVVITLEVKAINHEEYIIYTAAYSKTGNEIVRIENVSIKEKDTVLVYKEVGNIIEFVQQDSNSLYMGYVNAGTFTEEDVTVEHGKKYDIIVEAAVCDNGLNVSKTLTYEVEIIQYMSWVWPT